MQLDLVLDLDVLDLVLAVLLLGSLLSRRVLGSVLRLRRVDVAPAHASFGFLGSSSRPLLDERRTVVHHDLTDKMCTLLSYVDVDLVVQRNVREYGQNLTDHYGILHIPLQQIEHRNNLLGNYDESQNPIKRVLPLNPLLLGRDSLLFLKRRANHALFS